VLLERLSYGAFVARHTGLPILVTGAPREAVTMQTSLVRDFGVPVRWVENQSRDTFENARYTAQMLKPEGIGRIILITSSTHLWRAVHEYEDAGFEVVPAPAGRVGATGHAGSALHSGSGRSRAFQCGGCTN